MTEQSNQEMGDRTDHNKASINRIRRLQGQLAALERILQADEESCEERVIRARTIEKGVNSLISHMVTCYIDNTIRHRMEADSETATQEVTRLFNLLNR